MNFLEILYGLILTLILSIVLGLLLGSPGSFTGFLFGTIIVGYRVGDDIAQGAIHGGIVALLTGIVFASAMISMTSSPGGIGTNMMEMGISSIIVGIMLDGIIGSVGGTIGSYIRDKMSNFIVKPQCNGFFYP